MILGLCDPPVGGRSQTLDEPLSTVSYVSVFIPHFIGNPAENHEILRKLYIDFDLSSYQRINVILNKYRKDETGDVRKNPIRKLLLKKSKDLEPWVKRMIREWLKDKPQLKQIYEIKERLHGFYNIKGMKRASRILTKITDDMADMKIPELQTLRRTLMRWREYILNFFENKLTNGRTEGFNRKAKLIQRNAYGFKNFENYRKRLIYSCR